jgi:WD40 repeat protein
VVKPARDASQFLPAARAGSSEALGQALEICRGYLLRVANQGLNADLRAKGGASDLVQETFLEAQRDFGCFQGASCGWDKTVRLWDTTSRKELRTLTGAKLPISRVAFAPDGQQLAAGDGEGIIRIWETNTGREVRTIKAHAGEITGLAFTPDGQRLASCRYSDGVKLWETATGRIERHFGGDTSPRSLAFSADGRCLATGGYGEITLWDTATCTQKSTLRGHARIVHALAFAPDGRRLASAGADKTVRLWDPASGVETLCLTEYRVAVAGVAFSPDGLRLASASGFRGQGELKVREIPGEAKKSWDLGH